MFFVQTCENLTQGFEIFLQNWRKYCIFCNFLEDFLQIFENSPASGGRGPRTPSEAGLNLNHPKFFLAYATVCGWAIMKDSEPPHKVGDNFTYNKNCNFKHLYQNILEHSFGIVLENTFKKTPGEEITYKLSI